MLRCSAWLVWSLRPLPGRSAARPAPRRRPRPAATSTAPSPSTFPTWPCSCSTRTCASSWPPAPGWPRAPGAPRRSSAAPSRSCSRPSAPSHPDHVWGGDVVPMRGQDGAVTGGMAVARDVPEKRRAEQERRRLLARLYEVLEGQHQRLAADLHDSHLQSLAVLGLRLDQARLRLGSDQPETTGALLNQLRAEVAAEGAALRRTIGALRPLLLDQRGLSSA